jgi:hypothetical protein
VEQAFRPAVKLSLKRSSAIDVCRRPACPRVFSTVRQRVEQAFRPAVKLLDKVASATEVIVELA